MTDKTPELPYRDCPDRTELYYSSGDESGEELEGYNRVIVPRKQAEHMLCQLDYMNHKRYHRTLKKWKDMGYIE